MKDKVKGKIKVETKRKLYVGIAIVSFVVIISLIWSLLPDGYGWFKY